MLTIMDFSYIGILVACGIVSVLAADMKKEIPPEKLETCLDHKGKVVSHGDRFFPLGSDPCTQCTCLNGKPEMCISVFCSAPENCREYHALTDKCCEFVCLDRDFPNKGSGNGSYPDPDSLNTTNLGLRLVASTVTSFLILALLLFMIHRLRQRRLLLMIRRFHARRMDNGNAHLSRRYSEDDDGSVGYFVGHDHLDFSRYDEPPPPYTLWKPPEMYIPPGEAPPPYDLSVQLTAPFTGGNRYNFNSNGRPDVAQQQPLQQPQQQQQRTVSVNPVENSSETPPVMVAPSTVAIIHHTAMEHPPDLLPAMATMRVINNMEVQPEITQTTSGRVVLPPDLQYEETTRCGSSVEASTSQPNIEEIPERIGPSASESIPSNNMQSNSTIPSNNEDANTAIACCTCNVAGKEQKTWSKRHSCSEFSEQYRLKGSRSRREKRLSLTTGSHNQNNNLYPDPTVWNGEASESSSSSSPTYEQPTPSPSTSDSSFADAEFSRHPRAEVPSRKTRLTPSFQENVKVPPGGESGFTAPRSSGDEESKAPPFQKTLSNLKKFSLIKRKKKKKRQDDRHCQISCSFVCQNLPEAVFTPQPLAHLVGPEASYIGRSNDTLCARPMEAINPHIGHKLASSGVKRGGRPAMINVPGQMHRQLACGVSGNSGYYNSIYPNSNAPSSSFVSVHRLKGRGNASESCYGSLNENGQFQSNHNDVSGHSPSSACEKGIIRSGSICSETGERRYHKSSPNSPSPGSSSSRLMSDEHNMHNQLRQDSRCSSSICVPTESRTLAVGTHLGSLRRSRETGDCLNPTTPVWIVNSEATLPRRDYHLDPGPSTSGILSRCLSAGQISENSIEAVLGSNLHPALQIRDPSMCDSSWEACSHL